MQGIARIPADKGMETVRIMRDTEKFLNALLYSSSIGQLLDCQIIISISGLKWMQASPAVSDPVKLSALVSHAQLALWLLQPVLLVDTQLQFNCTGVDLIVPIPSVQTRASTNISSPVL
jgi:hypothetical protein